MEKKQNQKRRMGWYWYITLIWYVIQTWQRDTTEKAKRRLNEFKKKNKHITINEVEKSLKLRDFNDRNRKESPLLFVKGAVLVDTTKLDIKQMEVKLFKLVREKINNKINGNI